VGHFDVAINSPDLSLEIKIRKRVVESQRVGFTRMCVVDLSTGLPLLSPFIPNRRHVANQVVACCHRFGRAMPPIGVGVDDFLVFAKAFIVLYVRRLRRGDVKNFDDWLENCAYSGARKGQLREVRDEVTHLTDKFSHSKSFIKDEGYVEPKNPRPINSYSDESKVLLGPLVQAADKSLFGLKWFVKGTHPRDWPRRMRDLFGTGAVLANDFSSFEAHHREEYQYVLRFWMMHVLRDVAPSWAKRLILRMMGGENVTKFSTLTASIEGRLMSGALWTSSGNGLLNLLFMSYLCGRSKHPQAPAQWLAENVDSFFVGLIEGDDGLAKDTPIDEKLVSALGLDMKPARSSNFGESAFCGVLCDPEILTVVCDPRKVLRNFFVLPEKYRNARPSVVLALYRAKALSYKCNYLNAPIVGELAHRVCDLTRGLDVSCVSAETDAWKRPFLETAVSEKLWQVAPVVHDLSRIAVQKAFGVAESIQLDWEARIRGWEGGALQLPLLDFVGENEFSNMRFWLPRDEKFVLRDAVPLAVQEIVEKGKVRFGLRSAKRDFTLQRVTIPLECSGE